MGRFVNNNRNKELEIEDIVDAVSKFFDCEYSELTVMLMIDGIHNLNTEKESDTAKNCRMRNLLRETVNKLITKSKSFIFPISSCTVSIEARESLFGSSVNAEFFPLPFIKTIPCINNKQIRLSQRLFDIMGGHARAVEAIAQFNTDYEIDRISQSPDCDTLLRDAMRIALSKKYKPLSNEWVACILKASLNGEKFYEDDPASTMKGSTGTFHISSILSNGLLSLKDNQLHISGAWILLHSSVAASLLAEFPWSYEGNSECWEKFNIWFRCILGRLRNKNEMIYYELHDGMYWSKNTYFEEKITTHVTISNKPASG